MADIQPATSGNTRRKLSTPRIDLTPMVDLGFLLITFFMYTTTMARPKVMELQMPYRPDVDTKPTPIPAEATLVIIPMKGHRIAYYPGTQQNLENFDWCMMSGTNSLRNILQRERTRVKALPASFSKEGHKLHVLIKPDTSAAYDDIVRALDEMAISEVPYYTIMHPTSQECKTIQKISRETYGK